MSTAVESLLRFAPQLADGMKQGGHYVMVCCPFHGESTPSMSISTFKPVFTCFACKSSGHIAQLFTHFGMPRAVVDAILPRSSYTKPDTVRDKIVKGLNPFRGKFALNEGILDAYRLMPYGLKDAGFKVTTLRHFEVGWDSKNDRITFPLRTAFGDLVGVSGRANIDGVEPRYKIYDKELKERNDYQIPDTYTMSEVKSAVLWHAHVVRPLFFLNETEHDRIILTEGFKACMWTWQVGYEDTVALIGSSLSPTQAELIARATRHVTLFLDNNEAGISGTLRAGKMLTQKGCVVDVATYPDEREQPDDLTPEEVFLALDCPTTFLAWGRAHRAPEPLSKWTRRVA